MPSVIDGLHLTESYVQALYNANYKQGRVYPTLAAGVTVVSAATDWVLGAITEVIPAGTVSVPFHASMVSIESCDKDGVFELAMYHGPTDIPMSTIRFAVQGGYFGNQLYLIPSVKILTDVNLSAALACSDGTAGAATIMISIVYREVT